jgi:hypothetical protein
LRKDSSRRFSRKATLLTLTVAVTAVGVAGSAVATGSTDTTAARGGGGGTPTIHATFSRQKGIRFVGPDRISTGQNLRFVSNTDPRVVGPHTFSLVTRGVLPKTRNARRNCFAPNHICREIAAWHGSNGRTPPTDNPAENGQDGWDRLGNLNRDGDSFFTARRGGSITQQVSVDASKTPERLYYMCAIHPFMQGSINVVP